MRTIVWFRGKDLRLADHAPLCDGLKHGEVIPLFVVDPYFFAPERAVNLSHRMQFLLDSMRELGESIAKLGSKLIVVAGHSVEVIPRLFREWRADRVVAHRWIEPFARRRDDRIAHALGKSFVLFDGITLLPPASIRTQAGTPYSVFTQYARRFQQRLIVPPCLPPPRSMSAIPKEIASSSIDVPTLDSLGLCRNQQLICGGERSAHERLRAFFDAKVETYIDDRNDLGVPRTSRLSADLKFGTLSIRQVWSAVTAHGPPTESLRAFQNELVWREFALHTLYDRPELLEKPFRQEFEGFPWLFNETHWQAWAIGKTGFPVVDAAARQLLGEGFVHNRARMIAASFLCKHLRIDYRFGERHYMQFLVDGDWAPNNMGWQWSAGCGCDAQPYFRVFNPIVQGERFDTEGGYVRRWVPELARLPNRFIHRPYEAPPEVLKAAGITSEKIYPRPIVDHRVARDRFLSLASEWKSAQRK